MATKKECDRCKTQWDMHVPESSYDAIDTKTCLVGFDIPGARSIKTLDGYVNRDKIKEEKELCQDCAREVYTFLMTAPEVKNDIQSRA